MSESINQTISDLEKSISPEQVRMQVSKIDDQAHELQITANLTGLKYQVLVMLKELRRIEGKQRKSESFNVAEDGSSVQFTLNTFGAANQVEIPEEASLFEKFIFFTVVMFMCSLLLLGFLSLINYLLHF